MFAALRPIQRGYGMAAEDQFKTRQAYFAQICFIIWPIMRGEGVVIGQFIHIGKQFSLFSRLGTVLRQMCADFDQILRGRAGEFQCVAIRQRQVFGR